MKKLSIILSVFALFASSCGTKKQAEENIRQYGGIYKFGGDSEGAGGVVYIYPETDNTALFYLEKNRGAPSYNSGTIDGRITIKNGKATFKELLFDGFEDYCILHFEFGKNTLTVKQEDDCNCGFGFGVFVNDTFKRTSSEIPQYYINREDRKIYFSELQKDEEMPAEITLEKLQKKGDIYYFNNVPFSGKAINEKEQGCWDCMEEQWEMKDGKFHGKYESSGPGIHRVGNYEYGKKHGEWITNDHNIRIVEHYKDGKEHGEWKYFDDSDDAEGLYKTETYKDGVKIKEWTADGLEATIIKTIKAYQNKDEETLNNLILKDFGIAIMHKPGVMDVFDFFDKISFNSPVPEYYPYYTDLKIDYKINFEKLPKFSCDTEKWNKPFGIYCDTTSTDKMLSRTAKNMNEYLEAGFWSVKQIQKIEILEKNRHFKIIVLGKDGYYFKFFLTFKEDKWHLTIIDRTDYCSA